MNSIWIKSLIAVGILLSGSVYGAEAEPEGSDNGIVVRPYATTGFQFYEFGFNSEGSVDSNYLYLGVGATALMDRIYVDVNYSTSLAAEFEEGNLDRDDFSAAVGYLLSNGFAVFGGYTKGITDFDYNYGSALKYEADGLFGGGSYQWTVNDRIQLNVHGALAFLNASFGGRVELDGFGSQYISSSDVDSIGGSFGFSASTTLTDNISVSGFIKTQSYNYDNFEAEVDETLTSLGVKVGMVL